MRNTLLLLCVLVVVGVGCAPQKPSVTGRPDEGQAYEAPGFSIPSLDGSGGSIDLASYEGQVVLLDFWATWCPPCRVELPALNKLYEELKDEGFVLIGMTVDQGSPAQVSEAVSRYQLKYPVGLAGPEAQQAYGGIRAVPTKFLLDRQGAVRKHYVGVVQEAQLRSDIEELLKM